MKNYRTLWISDVHLGTKGCQAEALLEFIKESECNKLYLVGDIIDIWALRRGIHWPQYHNDVVQKLLRMARKGTEVIYIPGNHDEFLVDFFGDFGNVTIRPNDIHTTVDGRKILVMHGHEMDSVIRNAGWLAHVGDVGYKMLLGLNGIVNWWRRKLGKGYWSLSAYIKNEVKNVVNFISNFEESILRYAKEADVQGVLCGHIHHPTIRTMGDITYYNTGDWVESCSAIGEDMNGKLHLIRHHPWMEAKVGDLLEEPLSGSSEAA
jgi:UDP-2,3-diacylglucosamine pyrophosphatase LpxH